jgi:vanillate/4-hydroxybenzoate decarboxylase subunit C
MWALTTRVRPSKDVILIPNAPGMPLDPSSEPAGLTTKVIIDATTPVAPDVGRETELLEMPEQTEFWLDYLKKAMRKER